MIKHVRTANCGGLDRHGAPRLTYALRTAQLLVLCGMSIILVVGLVGSAHAAEPSTPAAPTVTSPVDGSITRSAEVSFSAVGEDGLAFKCKLDAGEWGPCPAPSGPAPGDGGKLGVGWDTVLHWGEAGDWTQLAWGQSYSDSGSPSVQWNGSFSRSDFITAFGSDSVSPNRLVGLVSMVLGVNLSCSYIAGLASSIGLYVVVGTPDHAKLNSLAVDCAATEPEEVTPPQPAVFTGLTEGSHTLLVRQDRDGGIEGDVKTVTWTVDQTPPAQPTFTAAPAQRTRQTSASVAFTGEPGASFECKLDSGSWSACVSPRIFSGLSEGAHSASVRQIDQASNVGNAAVASWVVDTTPPPRPTISSGPSSPTTALVAQFAFAGESGAKFECALNSGVLRACTSPMSVAKPPVGQNSFTVVAVDAAGNGSKAASRSFRAACAPPEVSSPTTALVRDPTFTGAIARYRWETRPQAAPSPGDTRASCQLLTVQVSSSPATSVPGDELPSKPFRLSDGVFEWSGIVYSHYTVQPRWLRAGNRSGVYSAWKLVKAVR